MPQSVPVAGNTHPWPNDLAEQEAEELWLNVNSELVKYNFCQDYRPHPRLRHELLVNPRPWEEAGLKLPASARTPTQGSEKGIKSSCGLLAGMVSWLGWSPSWEGVPRVAWSLMSKTPHLNLVTWPDQHKSVNPHVPRELSIRAPHEHCA